MQVTVFSELPLDDEDAAGMIEKAREVGYPLLAVRLEEEGTRSAAGFALGTKVAELDQEMSALGTGGGRNVGKTFEVVP